MINDFLNVQSRGYGKNVSYFMRSQEVILWALLNEIILPEEIQKILCIHQLTTKPRKNSDSRVINQIIMQYILMEKPVISIRDVCLNHKWINRFGTGTASQDENRRALQRNLKELLDNDGKYIHQAIPAVMQKREGIPCYNFRLLKIAMQTASKVFVDKIGELNYFAHTEDSFQQAFLNDAIVQLYIDSASLAVINLIKDFCLQKLYHYQYAHYKLQSMPKEIRRPLTFRELSNLNRDLIVRPLDGGFANLKIKKISMCIFFPKKFSKDTPIPSLKMVVLRSNIKQSYAERLLAKYTIGEKP